MRPRKQLNVDDLVRRDPEHQAAKKTHRRAAARLARAKVAEDAALIALSSIRQVARERAFRSLYLSQPEDLRTIIRSQGSPTPTQRDTLIRLGFWHSGGSSYDGGHPPGPVSMQPSCETYWRWEVERFAKDRPTMGINTADVESVKLAPVAVADVFEDLALMGFTVETEG